MGCGVDFFREKPARQGVPVAAAQTDDHPQGAAQEHEGAHHHAEAQHKAGHGGRAAPDAEFLSGQRHNQGAQDQTGDLRTDVLYNGGGVQLHTTGNVPQETGDAEAHVGRIAQQYQHNGRRTHNQSRQDDQAAFFPLYHRISSFNQSLHRDTHECQCYYTAKFVRREIDESNKTNYIYRKNKSIKYYI